jgi:fructose-1,6-bisphosphatase I
LNRFILTEQKKYPNAKGDLSIILNSVGLACKIISSAAQGAGIFSLYGLSGGANASGDEVKKLDVFSNDCMINTVSWSGKIGIMASEEIEDPLIVENCEDPKYCIMFDPLDGSSNIDANVSVGTIFAISRCSPKPTVDDLLQTGDQIIAAGYCMYGDATMLVISFGDSVNGFTLDPQIGEFILTHRNIRIPKKGKIYSVNEGNAKSWDPVITAYVAKCKDPPLGKPKKARYIGSMVADVHRTLLYGGIFMYPASKKAPNGKLRLLYELNPMAFIVEAAGGKASTGVGPILKVIPDHIHCRAPVFLGSVNDVTEIEEMYKSYHSNKNQNSN